MVRDKFRISVLTVSIASVAILPVYSALFVYPAFTQALSDDTEEDAVCIARHLAERFIPEHSDITKDALTARFMDEAEILRKNFEIRQIKIFSPEGEIVNSTDPKDIGEINSREYFHQVVARGNNFTKIVRRDDKSLEGHFVSADVVETYVPIMRKNRFAGAFEIYLDITKKKARIDNLIRQSHITASFIMLVLLSAVFASSAKTGKYITQLRRTQEALKNANRVLESQATTDALTGISNRIKFCQALNSESSRAVRYGRELSLIMFDIDHFKRVNDMYGHPAGDRVLLEITELVACNVRPSDVFARWGGEEFMVLVPEIELKHAIEAAEKLRVLIESHPCDCVGRVTCSFGVTAFRHDETVELFIERVDKALYTAKTNGRNQVASIEPQEAVLS